MMKRTYFVVMLCLLSCGLAYAQITTAGMSGRVTTEGESAIGASVIALHEPSGTSYGTVTNVDGRFSLQGMRSGGPYKVTISYIGYQSAVYTDIKLQLGETYALDVALKQSDELLQEVIVTASKSKFSAEKTGATTNISPEQLTMLPSINRSLSDFTRLSPYASGNTFAGRDGRSNSFTIDGANLNNNFGLSSDLPGGGNPISLDAIEEVQVVIAPYDVRQNNFVGGGINAITKSGTNTFKGTAYTYYNNEVLRGNKIGDTDFGKRNAESKTVYGATLGGPIIKNKLFFFASAEYEKTPKQVVTWRASEDGVTNNSTISRAKQSDLDEFSRILKEQYGYDTGSSTSFPADISNVKLLGRIDWNINSYHKLSVRYNHTKNSTWNAPNGNSSDTGYRLNGMDRISKYSMSFANSCYSMDNVVNSVTAEVNSRFSQNISNQFLFTYSSMVDERGTNSSPFPFIDIMAGKDENGKQILEPYMSAGYELFTYNNKVENTVLTLVDNFTYYLGDHKLTAGVSFEHQVANNSYMRNGTGYYRFSSFDDFKNGRAPEAFALTYGYNGDTTPTAEVKFGQLGIYVQDEWNLLDNFKLTAGLRVDNLFFFDNLMRNNATYNQLNYGGYRFDTSQWPSSRFQFSPRVGFTWDVKKDKTLKVRGGSGFFTGRIPLVFFTNMPTNSGMVQFLSKNINTTYKNGVGSVSEDNEKLLNKLVVGGKYITDVNQMIDALDFPRTISPDEGALQSSVVGIDKDFKMPQVWKTSLAVDYQVPVSFPLSVTVEGMFTKDINAVRQYNKVFKPIDEETANRFEGPDNRYIYGAGSKYTYQGVDKNGNPATLDAPAAFFLTNTSKGWGYTANITVNAEPVKNLNLMFAYTHTESKEISGMPGSDASSAWTNVPSVNGPNLSGLQRSQYVTPDRIVASLDYRVSFIKNMRENFSLVYTGYSPGGYSFLYSNDMNQDNVNNDLLYIPRTKDELAFVSEADRDAFWTFVNQDSYLKKHKGEYAEAFAARAPFVHRFDFRFAHDLFTNIGKSKNTLQLSVDILNVGNLLNSEWGVTKNMSQSNGGKILTYEGLKAGTNTPTFSMYKNSDGSYPTQTYTHNLNYSECWKIQVGVRYIFN
ncbi:MAG: carboxypeptidase regulatory-like domain-containing protein [Prevotellaceae bacterium]|nr:carboxypeptidase regulatory-like domain-containing protein [Prevotellaceae bacterium]